MTVSVSASLSPRAQWSFLLFRVCFFLLCVCVCVCVYYWHLLASSGEYFVSDLSVSVSGCLLRCSGVL